MNDLDTLVLDFEAWQEYDIKKYGPAWCTGHLHVLCCGLKWNDDTTFCTENADKIRAMVKDAKVLVAHNGMYDFGILLMLGCDLQDKILVDTKKLAFLYDHRIDNSLGGLGKYFFGLKKDTDKLAERAVELGLFSYKMKDGTKEEKIKEELKRAGNWVMKNLDKLYELDPQLVQKYCVKDVDITRRVFDKLIPEISKDWITRINNNLQAALISRSEGTYINIPRAYEVSGILKKKEIEVWDKILQLVGHDFNPASNADMAKVCDELNIPYGVTPIGNPSFAKDWKDTTDHELCKLLSDHSSLVKCRRDFVDKAIDMQGVYFNVLEIEWKDNKPHCIGRIFPQVNLFGADMTGRFSSNSTNIQNQPSKGEIGKLVRSMFVPPPGKKMAAIDFSSQENRIQLHFAYLAKCQGAKDFKLRYDEDPNRDSHTMAASILYEIPEDKVDKVLHRSPVKAIRLGLDYGMGIPKLAKSLNVTEDEARELRDRYNASVPYASQLSEICKNILNSRGYIKTLLHRKIYKDVSVSKNGRLMDFAYKGMNQLVQGSAADQCIEAISKCYEAGISPRFPVHDELVFYYEDEKELEVAKRIMETCVDLTIPMVAEIGKGDSWGDCK